MLNLILVMAASVFFAYCSEWTGGRSLEGRLFGGTSGLC